MAKIMKRPGTPDTLDEYIDNAIERINPRVVPIPILKEVKDFIDYAVLIEKRTMFIFTDYDVDGVTSDTVAVKLFRYVYPEAEIIHRTPKRLSEGYGFSMKVLPEVPDNSILITIDNGIVAFDPIKAAKEKGCKVVVIDHHLGAEDGRLPDADFIVDPNAIEGQAAFTGYCGCGLIYKLSQMYKLPKCLAEELRGLAALATIADCVPLEQENWLIARDLNFAAGNTAIGALLEAYNIWDFTEGDAGFKVCPTLNAPGRLEDDGAAKAVKFLLGDLSLLDEMIALNEQRKELTETLMDTADILIEKEGVGKDNAICLVMDAPEGIVGILAGRIAEKYQCPTIVCARVGDGKLKGSARTCGNNHLKRILDKCSDLLLGYGGHAAAAGLTFLEANLPKVVERLNKLCVKEKYDAMYYDFEISPFYVQKSIVKILDSLDTLRPFGQNNPEPIFYISGLRLYPRGGGLFKTMGNKQQHLKLFGRDIDVVMFGKADEYISNPYNKINVVGKVGVNSFNGNDSYQMEALYLEEAKTAKINTTLQNALNKRAEERT